MKNVYWLMPALLAGRPGPDYAEWSLAELRSHGFRVVLNLSEFEPNRAQFQSVGITCEWMPLPNSYPADAEAEQACLHELPRVSAFIARHVEQGEAVLVHCAWGRDRTGIALATYLALHQGFSVEAAIAEVKRVQAEALSAKGWEAMANRVISRLT